MGSTHSGIDPPQWDQPIVGSIHHSGINPQWDRSTVGSTHSGIDPPQWDQSTTVGSTHPGRLSSTCPKSLICSALFVFAAFHAHSWWASGSAVYKSRYWNTNASVQALCTKTLRRGNAVFSQKHVPVFPETSWTFRKSPHALKTFAHSYVQLGVNVRNQTIALTQLVRNVRE